MIVSFSLSLIGQALIVKIKKCVMTSYIRYIEQINSDEKHKSIQMSLKIKYSPIKFFAT